MLTDYDLRSHKDFDLHSFAGGKMFRVKRTATLREFKVRREEKKRRRRREKKTREDALSFTSLFLY